MQLHVHALSRTISFNQLHFTRHPSITLWPGLLLSCTDCAEVLLIVASELCLQIYEALSESIDNAPDVRYAIQNYCHEKLFCGISKAFDHSWCLLTKSIECCVAQVLVSLTPWMEQLSLLPGDCECCDGLLKSMYYVTQLHGSRFSYEVEKLWSTVAGNPKNVRPLLDFLVSYGVDECSVQVMESW